ncbi:hypothetical protein GCM10027190_13810 [Spirosoma areae]
MYELLLMLAVLFNVVELNTSAAVVHVTVLLVSGVAVALADVAGVFPCVGQVPAPVKVLV